MGSRRGGHFASRHAQWTRNNFSAVKERKPGWGLFHRRPCPVPTIRGCLVLFIFGVVTSIAAIRGVYPFLAVNDPVPEGVLVVEGWGPDYAMEAARAEFSRHHYERLFVTGGPIEKGAAFSEFKTTAELSAATLIHLGMDSNVVQAVPTPDVRQDRTFASAVALKRSLLRRGALPAKINVMSLGVQSRRTRLLFEKALGRETKVGIVAVESRTYDPKHWWQTSQGFRVVSDEVVAYLYARLVFRPPSE